MTPLLLALLATQGTDAAPAVRAELQPLAFLVGHCWRGTFEESGAEDRHCFEPVYGGQHVRDRHEVRGKEGVYAGETLYSWNGKAIEFTYWNSLGGVSRGTLHPEGERLTFGDESYTGPDGAKIVISTYWQRDGADAYETVSTGGGAVPRRVRFERDGGHERGGPLN